MFLIVFKKTNIFSPIFFYQEATWFKKSVLNLLVT